MKENKILAYLQTLSILPLMFFLLIYPEYSFVSVLSFTVLFVLGGYNIHRFRHNKRLISYPLLILLLFSFFFYAFYGLGSKEAPQSYTVIHYKVSPTATFDFEKQVEIEQLCYFVGINKTVHFTLEYLEEKHWKTFFKHEAKFPFSFRWKCIDKNVTTSQIRLRTTKSEVMLNEVHFLHKGKSIPYVTQTKYLNDEQNLSIDTSYFGGMFFDEIYHSRTAYEILHDINVYETTHPYLGKLLILPGIKVFGMTPFGWRVSNVLFAGLFIVLMYYFALQLFRKRLFAFLAAFLLTYSFMHLTQSRIGLIDTFGVFFVFVSYYYLYIFIKKQKLSLLLLSAVFFGLASAVKWSAVFAALGFVLIALYLFISRYPLEKRFSGYRLLLYGVLSYGFISVAVYLLTFINIYLETGSFQKIIDYQFNMFNYHIAVSSTHPYGSPWWSWPIDFRPMCYMRDTLGTQYSSVAAFGNPAIFWLGTLSMFYMGYVMFKRHTLEASFILLAFLGLYLPYIFVGRQMFIYHFYYAVPFMMLGIIYVFKTLMKSFPQYCKYYMLYFLLVAGLFVAYYPVLSGYEVAKVYVNYVLKWFPGWWL